MLMHVDAWCVVNWSPSDQPGPYRSWLYKIWNHPKCYFRQIWGYVWFFLPRPPVANNHNIPSSALAAYLEKLVDPIWSFICDFPAASPFLDVFDSWDRRNPGAQGTGSPGLCLSFRLVKRPLDLTWAIGARAGGCAEGALGKPTDLFQLPSGYVKIAIENDHRNSGFSQL